MREPDWFTRMREAAEAAPRQRYRPPLRRPVPIVLDVSPPGVLGAFERFRLWFNRTPLGVHLAYAFLIFFVAPVAFYVGAILLAYTFIP